MKCDKHTMLLYAVTDRAWTGRETLRQQVEDALKGGVTCVQLREKELDDAAFLQEAMELSALCRSYGVPFIINDNVDIAIQCHADGIHVGQEDMAAADVRAKVGPDMLLGVSAHSVEEARLAVAHGADYLGVGAAFSTHTKTDVDVLPEGELKKICDAVDVPVVAIGGIHKDNILQLKGSGADGVALVSAIFGAEDIEAECRELKALAEQIIYLSVTPTACPARVGSQRLLRCRASAGRCKRSLFPPLAAVIAVATGRPWHTGKFHLFARGSPTRGAVCEAD